MEHGFKRVSVIGAGQMGHGIAQVCAQIGMTVTMFDISERALDKGFTKISHWTKRLADKGLLGAEERKQILSRITTASDLEPLINEADIVIETATEDQDTKFEIFRDLDERCRPRTILVSNTSSISITHIAASTSRPDKVMGMHFMNPVPRMQLVELIRGLTLSRLCSLACRARSMQER